MIILRIILTAFVAVTVVLSTLVFGLSAIIVALLGAGTGPGSVPDRLARLWGQTIIAGGFVRVVQHNREHALTGEARVFVANHMSWYDVPVLAAVLRGYSFVAKSELFDVPLFGKAIRSAGTIPIQRENRKAAFGAYTEAAARIRKGASVIVFPEGTRGTSYPLRPFKKGPFVLAIAAGVPVVPVLLYGTYEAFPRGAFLVRPGRFDVHFLEPVSTRGLGYEDRDELAGKVKAAMANALETIYGIPSPVEDGRRGISTSA